MVTWVTMRALAARLGRPDSTIASWQKLYTPWVARRRDETERVYVYPLEPYEEVAEVAVQHKHPDVVRAILAQRHGTTNVDLDRMGGMATRLERMEERLALQHREVIARLDAIERRLGGGA